MNALSHLHVLELHLSNERMRLHAATNQKEKDLRAVWVQQAEREVQGEIDFLTSKGIQTRRITIEIDDPDALLRALLD